MEEKAQYEPRCFLAHFGKKHASVYPVDGGCYPVPSWNEASQVVSKGDLLLLCCWSGHKGLFSGDAWGIGEVTDRKICGDGTYIYYKHKSLPKPVKRVAIESCLTEREKCRFKMGPVRGWAFLSEITGASFRCCKE